MKNKLKTHRALSLIFSCEKKMFELGDLPVVLSGDRFSDLLETFRLKLEHGEEGADAFRDNTTRQLAFATTNDDADAARINEKARKLKTKIFEVYREVFGKPPTNARYGVKFVVRPPSHEVRIEYEIMSVIVCHEAGLQVFRDGAWYALTAEQSASGVVVAGAFHPVLPATRYRFWRRVSGYLTFSVEPSCVTVATRHYFHALSADRGLLTTL